MKQLRHWMRPSLARRIVGSLLLAFVLVEAALLAIELVEARQALVDPVGLRDIADQLQSSLIGRDDHDAALATSISMGQINTLRRAGAVLPGEIEFRLLRAPDQVLLASPRWRCAVTSMATPDCPRPSYWVEQRKAGPLTLMVAEPAVDLMWVARLIAGDLTRRMLVAFPLVLLPVWWGVRLGIKPLRDLARQIEQREAHDLDPLPLADPPSELEPLVRAFDRLLERLRLHVAREHRLVNDAAHELRTPMAAIATQTHVLLHARSPDEREMARAHLERALARTESLSRQLLSLAALDHAATARPVRFDLVGQLENALAEVAPAAAARSIQLELQAPEHLELALDQEAWLAIVSNLLDNAIRHGAKGGRIEVRLEQTRLHEQAGIELSVADDGPGIAPAHRERAFDRFWRGPDVTQPGTGLGLAICRQAAERLLGRLWIDDGLSGRGITFRLLLPIH